MTRLLREHPPGARAPRLGPHAGLERPDRRSEDGSTDRKWPVPRRAARARPAARPPPQPPLLGAAPGLRRAARHQVRAVGYRSQRGAEERRARRRHGRSTSGRPGRSSAAGDALGRLRRHHLRAPRRPARTERSPGASQQARPPRARVRDRPHRARPADMGRGRSFRSRAQQRRYLTQSRDYEPNWSTYRYRPAEARRLLEQAGCRRGADGSSPAAETALVALRDHRRVSIRAQALSLIQAQLRAAGVEVMPVFAPPGVVLRPDPPAGGFDVALFSWAGSPAASWAPVYGCGGLQNFTGYCQRLVTAHLNQADRILDERSTRPCPQQSRPGARE